MTPTRARISQSALAANLARARESAPGCRIIAVVKANAYGHGLAPVARALARTDAYAVARTEEALILREAGLAHPVILLEGPLVAEDLDVAARFHLDVVIHSPEQLRMLELYRGSGRFNLWLKFETGMNRLGMPLAEAPVILRQLQSLACVARPLKLMSHLACAEERANPMTRTQVSRFLRAFNGLACDHSLANSAGVLAWPETQAVPDIPGHEGRLSNWVRPGVMLYGISPFADETGADHRLTPAMEFETRLIAIKRVARGESVGYGAQWRAERESVIGVAAAGYGDGYPRHLGNGTPVRVGAHVVPLAGRISMDLMTVDLTLHPGARVGDPVTLWGRDLPVETIARRAGTIGYELVCGITQRVHMVIED